MWSWGAGALPIPSVKSSATSSEEAREGIFGLQPSAINNVPSAVRHPPSAILSHPQPSSAISVLRGDRTSRMSCSLLAISTLAQCAVDSPDEARHRRRTQLTKHASSKVHPETSSCSNLPALLQSRPLSSIQLQAPLRSIASSCAASSALFWRSRCSASSSELSALPIACQIKGKWGHQNRTSTKEVTALSQVCRDHQQPSAATHGNQRGNQPHLAGEHHDVQVAIKKHSERLSRGYQGGPQEAIREIAPRRRASRR